MSVNQESVPSVSEQIKTQFNELQFTTVDGNSHYGSRNADELRVRNESVQDFLGNDERIEPFVDPTKYDQSTIESTIEKYESMLDVLFSQPNRTPDDEILIDKIIDKTSELFRYYEIILSVGSRALSGTIEHRRIASELSMELIGGIDQTSFDMLFCELTDMAHRSEQPFARELLDMVGKREAPKNSLEKIELTTETREKIGEDLLVLYSGLRELLAKAPEFQGKSLSPEEALPIFEELLHIADIDDEWTAELSNGKAAEASTSKKKVTIGKDRVPFKNYIDAVAVGFHESVVHGGRSEGVSLPDVRDFEEGIATRLQQIISGEERTPGVQYYLAIGLQVGADKSGELRSYRETFEILWRREALLMEKAGKPVDVQKAKATAQRHVQRTRRGGVVDTRDASYFVGAQKAAGWLNEISRLRTAERRELLAKVLTNKYDPTNPEHAAIMKRQ